MTVALKPKERKQFREELLSYVKSNEFNKFMEDNSKIMEIHTGTHKKYAININKDLVVSEILKHSTVGTDFSIIDASIFFQIHSEVDIIVNTNLRGAILLLYKNSRYYTINFPWGNIFRDIRLIEHSTDEEKAEKRKKKYSEYAIIKRNGQRALVKILAGNPDAIKKTDYIKNNIVNKMDDDEMILLFSLNKNI
jgi:hypothetical protein